MLGHVPIGAGQQQPVVGGERTGAPRLRAVDHPLVADAVGAGDDAGQIRSAAGLRQQLHEHLVTADRGRNVLALLLFAAGVEDRRAADGERRRVEDDRHLITAAFDVECPLVLDGQTEAAVFPREADAGESAFVEPLLELSGPQPRAFLAALDIGRLVRVDARHVVGQPRPRRGAAKSSTDSVVGADRRLGHEACLGQRVHTQVVVLGCAEHRAVQRDSSQEQVQVVLPRDADAAVQLDAVLHHGRCALADIGLGDADGHRSRPASALATSATAARRGGPAGLQPDLQVGEAVLERLVGRQRTAEGVPVERPLNREVQHGVEDADDLGALQHHRDLALALDQRRGLRCRPDRGGLVDLDSRRKSLAHNASPGRRICAARRSRRARPSAPGTGGFRRQCERRPAAEGSRRRPRRGP